MNQDSQQAILCYGDSTSMSWMKIRHGVTSRIRREHAKMNTDWIWTHARNESRTYKGLKSRQYLFKKNGLRFSLGKVPWHQSLYVRGSLRTWVSQIPFVVVFVYSQLIPGFLFYIHTASFYWSSVVKKRLFYDFTFCISWSLKLSWISNIRYIIAVWF